MKYLGIDYGTKRIGIATSDDTGAMAFPFTTITAGPHAVAEVAALIAKENIENIVIGESRNFKGEANVVMEDIEQFKKDLQELCGLPVVYEQEFFSSAAAARQFTPDASPEGRLRPRGSRKENPNQEKLDAAAAALILQSYLDRLKSHG